MYLLVMEDGELFVTDEITPEIKHAHNEGVITSIVNTAGHTELCITSWVPISVWEE